MVNRLSSSFPKNLNYLLSDKLTSVPEIVMTVGYQCDNLYKVYVAQLFTAIFG